jgi:hypothetical protein
MKDAEKKLRDAVESSVREASENVQRGGDNGNAWEAFLAWLRGVWQAILRMLGLDGDQKDTPRTA